MAILSGSAFFSLLKVVRALYAMKQILPEQFLQEEKKFKDSYLLLMTDLFSTKPVVQDPKYRARIIAELQIYDSLLFGNFLATKLNPGDAQKVGTPPIAPIAPTGFVGPR
jgi:hypothetical protein